jgi:Rod binding domain-containing protein
MDMAVQSIGDVALGQATALRGLGASATGGVDKAAKDFEGMFFAQMLQPMFEGLGSDPVFGGGNGEQIMRSFLVQEYGKIMAQNSRTGIADAVKAEMIRAQATQKDMRSRRTTGDATPSASSAAAQAYNARGATHAIGR